MEESTVLVVRLLVTFPWCFNFHCATQELAVASLQNRIDRLLDDDRRGSCRLRFVPSVYLLVYGRKRFGLVDKRLGLGVAGFGGEQG